jgi:16S rRNA (guanine(527)-N(7))-methyltransferase RsmG
MFHVKHSLENTLQKLNIEANEEKTEKLLLYLEELMRWNKKLNLVSRKLNKEEVLTKLLLPSFLPYEIIKKGEKILDFGAGGGIASIPLKIFKPDILLHLLESKKKSVVFLEHISLLLDLDLNIINKFVKKEEDINERFDWVFVRAVNPEEIPKGISDKILYHGEYTGEKFICKRKIAFRGKTISVLI